MENGRRHQTGLRRFPHLLLFRWVWRRGGGGYAWLIVSCGESSAMLIVTSAECKAKPVVICGECSAVQPRGKRGGEKSHSAALPRYLCHFFASSMCGCAVAHVADVSSEAKMGPGDLRGSLRGLLVGHTSPN